MWRTCTAITSATEVHIFHNLRDALKVTLAVGHNQRLAEAFRGSYDNVQDIAFTDPNTTLAAECRTWLDPAPSGTKACPTDFAVFSTVGTV